MPDQRILACPKITLDVSTNHQPHPFGDRSEWWCPGEPFSAQLVSTSVQDMPEPECTGGYSLDHQLEDKASDYPPNRVVMPGVGKEAEIEVNENGAGQSKIPYAFQLIDGLALASMAAVLKEGADKYGADNWRMLPIEDHLGHMIMHAYAWLAGDRQDDHLSHIMCRATFAQGVSLQKRVYTQADVDAMHAHGFNG